MVDRTETKPLRQWLTQPSAAVSAPRPPLRMSNWAAPTIPSAYEGSRVERRITPYDMSARTISINPNRHPSRLRRSLAQTEQHSQGHAINRISASGISSASPNVEVNSDRPSRLTSAYQRTPRRIPNPAESAQQDAPVESSSFVVEERLACEMTMTYAPEDSSSHEEIIVMQHHSTGDTLLVYRGYLTKNDTFSFKSRRRPTSTLSLAFYVDGVKNTVINECCEYKCTQVDPDGGDHKPFLFTHNDQRANPCAKCRKDYAAKLLQKNEKNTALVQQSKIPPQNVQVPYDSWPSPKKTSKQKKSKPPVDTSPGYPMDSEATPVVPPSTVQSKESPAAPPPPLASTEKPDETEAVAETHTEFDPEQFQQLFANFLQSVTMETQQPSVMKHHPQSVENFCYILENQPSITDGEQQALRSLINLGLTFDDVNSEECVKVIRSITNERIILILSKASMENLAKPIREEPYLSAIYVIDPATNNSFDSKLYRGSVPNIAQLCKQLENDLPLLAYDLTIISSVPPGYEKMSTFNYVQALKDILLEVDEQRSTKKVMVEFCREKYADNAVQLKLIDEFETTFEPDHAIQWYSRQEAVIYKMLTRGFRNLDLSILYKLRYFIQHLHRQLESSDDTSPLTVYRTLRVRKEHFQKMESCVGGLLSFNEFLLVSKTQPTTEPSPMNKESKLVRFQINLGAGISRQPVTTIRPDAVLLTMGTVFRIDKLEPATEEICNVTLTTNADIVKAGRLMTKELRDAVRGPFPLVRMLKLLRQKDSHDEMDYFCSLLMNDAEAAEDEAANLALGGVLHSLGGHCYEKKQYDQGLVHLQNALKVYCRVLPPDDVRLTPTYNNIGSIYHRQDLNELALEYHMKAYEIQKNSSNPDMESVAAYVGNIAGVLGKLGKYKEAIKYYEMDVQFKQKLNPNKDKGEIAAKYHNLASMQYRAHLYAEALENYQKCLDIELRYHKVDNPTVGVTYHNLATALDKLERLQEAKEAVEKAIERLLRTKKEDDEDVQMNRKYLQQLEQKIWMKSIFATT